MSTRRALVVVAIFLLLTVVAASIDPRPLRGPSAPVRPSSGSAGRSPTAPAGAGGETVEVRLRRRSARAPERRVPAAAHVVLTAEVDAPGEVSIEGLELIASASPAAPAVFDLLATRAGRYPVLFTPSGGDAEEIGTLVVAAA